jgi:serine/threonine protein kinase
MRPVTLIRTPLEKEESDRLLALTKTMASSRDRRFIRIYDSITHGRNRWTVCEPFGGECLEQVLRTRGAQAPTYSADIVKQIAEAAGTTSAKFSPAPWIDARNVWVSSEEVRFVPLAVNGMDPDELGWEVEATGNLFWYCLTGTPRKGLERDTSKFAVPPGMRRILDRCLSPKPKQRYESPAQIAADLATYKWLPNFSVNSPSASLDREELLATLTIVEGNTASQPWWARFGFKRAA